MRGCASRSVSHWVPVKVHATVGSTPRRVRTVLHLPADEGCHDPDVQQRVHRDGRREGRQQGDREVFARVSARLHGGLQAGARQLIAVIENHCRRTCGSGSARETRRTSRCPCSRGSACGPSRRRRARRRRRCRRWAAARSARKVGGMTFLGWTWRTVSDSTCEHGLVWAQTGSPRYLQRPSGTRQRP